MATEPKFLQAIRSRTHIMSAIPTALIVYEKSSGSVELSENLIYARKALGVIPMELAAPEQEDLLRKKIAAFRCKKLSQYGVTNFISKIREKFSEARKALGENNIYSATPYEISYEDRLIGFLSDFPYIAYDISKKDINFFIEDSIIPHVNRISNYSKEAGGLFSGNKGMPGREGDIILSTGAMKNYSTMFMIILEECMHAVDLTTNLRDSRAVCRKDLDELGISRALFPSLDCVRFSNLISQEPVKTNLAHIRKHSDFLTKIKNSQRKHLSNQDIMQFSGLLSGFYLIWNAKSTEGIAFKNYTEAAQYSPFSEATKHLRNKLIDYMLGFFSQQKTALDLITNCRIYEDVIADAVTAAEERRQPERLQAEQFSKSAVRFLMISNNAYIKGNWSATGVFCRQILDGDENLSEEGRIKTTPMAIAQASLEYLLAQYKREVSPAQIDNVTEYSREINSARKLQMNEIAKMQSDAFPRR